MLCKLVIYSICKTRKLCALQSTHRISTTCVIKYLGFIGLGWYTKSIHYSYYLFFSVRSCLFKAQEQYNINTYIAYHSFSS